MEVGVKEMSKHKNKNGNTKELRNKLYICSVKDKETTNRNGVEEASSGQYIFLHKRKFVDFYLLKNAKNEPHVNGT